MTEVKTWHDPRTWADNDVILARTVNAELRDNFLALAARKNRQTSDNVFNGQTDLTNLGYNFVGATASIHQVWALSWWITYTAAAGSNGFSFDTVVNPSTGFVTANSWAVAIGPNQTTPTQISSVWDGLNEVHDYLGPQAANVSVRIKGIIEVTDSVRLAFRVSPVTAGFNLTTLAGTWSRFEMIGLVT